MSFDLLFTLSFILLFATAVLTGLAFLRGIEMGRAFIGGVYRRRAFWIAALLFAIELSNVASLVPAVGNSVAGAVIFFGMIVVVLAFVDGVILVAQQTDFFHRGILAWQPLRWVLYPVVIMSVILEIVSFVAIPPFASSPPPGTSTALVVAFYQFDVVVPVCFTYAAVVLAIGARRTPDRTLKSHARFLGLALLLFIATIVISIPGTELWSFFANVTGLVSIYFLYRAVMALSPLGRVTPLDLATLPSTRTSLGEERTNNQTTGGATIGR